MKHTQKLDKRLYSKYMKDPPTYFKCDNGDIYMSESLTRNILVSIKHLKQELDALMLFVGREGSCKSLFM